MEANHIATVHDPWGGVRQFSSLHLSNLNNENPVEWEFDIDAGFFVFLYSFFFIFLDKNIFTYGITS